VAGLGVAASFWLLAVDELSRTVSLVVYGLSTSAVFGVSAAYHIGNWPPSVRQRLRSLDHAGIFVLIAAITTPYLMHVLGGWERSAVLLAIWLQALLGVIFIGHTLRLPRWAHTGLYYTMGWPAVVILTQLIGALPLVTLALILLTVALYSAGAVVYALRRPNPWPRVLGFHEIFHGLVVSAVVVNTLVVWMWIVPYPRA
jgi:hemolysin III